MTSQPFLKEIASRLQSPGRYNLSQTYVVFPNKRARLYVSRYIGEMTPGPVWSPRYWTISELMEDWSGYHYADTLTQLFTLYQVYQQVVSMPENFDRFYTYAESLLSDFDEMDKYLVKADDLFSNLIGLKDLEGRFSYLSEEQIRAIRRFWNTFDPEKAVGGQEAFLSIWTLLPDLYSGLRLKLSAQGMAYEGMAYRKTLEDLSSGAIQEKLVGMRFLFVGFNALNLCEEKLFLHLKQSGQAEFFWDYDDWYTQDEQHEAGHFIRRNLRQFPSEELIAHDYFSSSGRPIFFLPVPSNAGQAGVLPYLFDKLKIRSGNPAQHTAIVLADESMLIPVLYAIPDEVEELNITMGYPLAGSAMFSLVDALYELDKNKRSGGPFPSFYYKDVILLLENPLLKYIYQEDLDRVRGKVAEKNMIYLKQDDILEGKPDDLLFKMPDREDHAGRYLIRIVEFLLREQAKNPVDLIQTEILYQVYLYLTRLNDLLEESSGKPKPETLFRMIRRLIRNLHIPFRGEPISGIQILGLLETRTLDFDRVIILSMNEGTIPRTTSISSFIPPGLRAGFGLPGPDHTDAMYAYYFYRLIQRAEQVVLVYDSSTGGLRTGERSRFLHQLYYELPHRVKEIHAVHSIGRLPERAIRIEKTGNVLTALMKLSGQGARLLSPSAINEYLNCSLRFYFHYLASLPQPDEVAEEIDARMFGNLMHHTMHKLYVEAGNAQITAELLNDRLGRPDRIGAVINRAFQHELFGEKGNGDTRKIEGFNQVVRKVLETYVKNLIRIDLNRVPFRIIGLEQKIETSFELTASGKTWPIRLGGTVDRIDEKDGCFRIVDYKTGTVKNRFASVGSLFDVNDQSRNEAVFQVLVYGLVYRKLFPERSILPALSFVRSSHAQDFTSAIYYGEKKRNLEGYEEVSGEFESLLRVHLGSLFDLEQPFKQTDDRTICAYCPYALICNREDAGD